MKLIQNKISLFGPLAIIAFFILLFSLHIKSKSRFSCRRVFSARFCGSSSEKQHSETVIESLTALTFISRKVFRQTNRHFFLEIARKCLYSHDPYGLSVTNNRIIIGREKLSYFDLQDKLSNSLSFKSHLMSKSENIRSEASLVLLIIKWKVASPRRICLDSDRNCVHFLKDSCITDQRFFINYLTGADHKN